MSLTSPKVAIVGAGLAGLTCARELSKSQKLSVTVIEKSSVLGGRCATKSWAHSKVDHGVHSFTIQSSQLKSLLFEDLKLNEQQIQKFPSHTFAKPYPDTTYSLDRFYCTLGNNFLGKVLANDLNLIHHATVHSISTSGKVKYRYHPRNSSFKDISQQYDFVVCAIPLPQAAAILDVPSNIHDIWSSIYAPNLTALLQYDIDKIPSTSLVHDAINLQGPSFYYCSTSIGDVSTWCENAKVNRQIAPSTVVIVTQASDAFSIDHLENEHWLPHIKTRTEKIWSIPSKALIQSFSKRWRYARVANPNVHSYMFNNIDDRILLTGDGITGTSQVESAILDGMRAAQDVMKRLNLSSDTKVTQSTP